MKRLNIVHAIVLTSVFNFLAGCSTTKPNSSMQLPLVVPEELMQHPEDLQIIE